MAQIGDVVIRAGRSDAFRPGAVSALVVQVRGRRKHRISGMSQNQA